MPVTLDGARWPEFADPPHAPSASARPSDRERPGRFEKLLHGLAAEIDRGEATVARAARGGYERMDPATLIALQAGIYRYGEAIDLTVKLADRAATAAKTVLEGGR
jgi:hypothetical protein